MSETIIPYPLLLPENACGCRWECFPQFSAKFDFLNVTKAKEGFPEFGTASTPPRRFLKHTVNAVAFLTAAGGGLFSASATGIVDKDSGDVSGTTSFTDLSGTPTAGDYLDVGTSAVDWFIDLVEPLAALGVGETLTLTSQTTTKTYRRTVYQSTSFPSESLATIRYEIVETFEEEHTSAMLTVDAIASLPSWGTFPSTPPSTVPRAAIDIADETPCYAEGLSLWQGAEPNRFTYPSRWELSTDELTFFFQRMRYKIALPAMLPCSFTVEWEEVFYPAGGGASTTKANCAASGVHTETESDIVVAVEPTENGDVIIKNARYTALS